MGLYCPSLLVVTLDFLFAHRASMGGGGVVQSIPGNAKMGILNLLINNEAELDLSNHIIS